jgi:cation transport ATPase
MVDGMWCTACAWVIENTLGRMDGVEAVACQFFTDRLSCRYRPDRVAPHEIRAAVARLGYDLRETDAGTADRQLQRRQLTRLAITGVLSGNVMMLSWALYAGFSPNSPRPPYPRSPCRSWSWPPWCWCTAANPFCARPGSV